jgi:hypothetical protein
VPVTDPFPALPACPACPACLQVGELQQQARAAQEQLSQATAAVESKDAEVAQLREQVAGVSAGSQGAQASNYMVWLVVGVTGGFPLGLPAPVLPTTKPMPCTPAFPLPLQASEAQQREVAARDGALAALQAEATASQEGQHRELEETRQQLQGEVGNLGCQDCRRLFVMLSQVVGRAPAGYSINMPCATTAACCT